MVTGSSSTAQQRCAVAEVLARLRAELQRLDLWEVSPPAADRLGSVQPFSWDTLMFPQWLQWQFLPRMSAALDGQELWPSDSAIHPYAEECLAGRADDVRELLFLIQTLDELICGAGAAPMVSSGRH
jgi:AmpD protein